jgi:hypothetical protein
MPAAPLWCRGDWTRWLVLFELWVERACADAPTIAADMPPDTVNAQASTASLRTRFLTSVTFRLTEAAFME